MAGLSLGTAFLSDEDDPRIAKLCLDYSVHARTEYG